MRWRSLKRQNITFFYSRHEIQNPTPTNTPLVTLIRFLIVLYLCASRFRIKKQREVLSHKGEVQQSERVLGQYRWGPVKFSQVDMRCAPPRFRASHMQWLYNEFLNVFRYKLQCGVWCEGDEHTMLWIHGQTRTWVNPSWLVGSYIIDTCRSYKQDLSATFAKRLIIRFAGLRSARSLYVMGQGVVESWNVGWAFAFITRLCVKKIKKITYYFNF